MKCFRKLWVAYAIFPALIVLSALLLTAGCSSQNNCPLCPASPPVNPNISFRLTDKTTNQDLFFGAQAQYSIGQISVYHIVDGKPDTAYLSVDSASHYFNLNIPTIHKVDTVTFQIANLPADTFLFMTSAPNKCCPLIKELHAVSFDGATIYTSSDDISIVNIKK